MSKNHDLKIWPEFYGPVSVGHKTFEYRNNDRNFQPGDTVTLRYYPILEAQEMDEDQIPDARKKWDAQFPPLTFDIGYVLKIPHTDFVVFSLLHRAGPRAA